MDYDYNPGWYPNENRDAEGHIVVAAYQTPQFAYVNRDTGKRPKLIQQRDILVRRWVTEDSIGRPEVYWSGGKAIQRYEWSQFSKYLRRRIQWAIKETRRIGGVR